MREVVGRLVRDAHPRTGCTTDDPAVPAPVHDQVQGAPETVDRGRDHVAGVPETLLGEQGNELDIITGKLAAGVAIIAVPTAVTGAYGQDVPYPGFSQMAGLVTSAVLIVVGAGGPYVLWRRRGWL
jgi:magnesium transporter